MMQRLFDFHCVWRDLTAAGRLPKWYRRSNGDITNCHNLQSAVMYSLLSHTTCKGWEVLKATVVFWVTAETTTAAENKKVSLITFPPPSFVIRPSALFNDTNQRASCCSSSTCALFKKEAMLEDTYGVTASSHKPEWKLCITVRGVLSLRLLAWESLNCCGSLRLQK